MRNVQILRRARDDMDSLRCHPKRQRSEATIAKLTEQAKRSETTGSGPVATTKIPDRKIWDFLYHVFRIPTDMPLWNHKRLNLHCSQ